MKFKRYNLLDVYLIKVLPEGETYHLLDDDRDMPCSRCVALKSAKWRDESIYCIHIHREDFKDNDEYSKEISKYIKKLDLVSYVFSTYKSINNMSYNFVDSSGWIEYTKIDSQSPIKYKVMEYDEKNNLEPYTATWLE